jgi:hypothetical protein
VCENRVLGRILECKRQEVAGGWRRLFYRIRMLICCSVLMDMFHRKRCNTYCQRSLIEEIVKIGGFYNIRTQNRNTLYMS